MLRLRYGAAQEGEIAVLIHEQLVALLGQGCVRLPQRLLLRPETSVFGVQGVHGAHSLLNLWEQRVLRSRGEGSRPGSVGRDGAEPEEVSERQAVGTGHVGRRRDLDSAFNGVASGQARASWPVLVQADLVNGLGRHRDCAAHIVYGLGERS